MVCRYCRKKIGPIRKLKDQHFCSDEHRKKATSKSARAVREAEDLYGFEETQLPTWRAITQVKREEKSGRPGVSTTVFAGLAVVFVLLALSQLPMGTPAAKAISPLPDANPHTGRGGFGQVIGNLLESKGTGTLREDFHAGVANWEGFKSVNSDWSMASGVVHPTSLRVWKPSTSMSNYEMEFMGQIERKSIDWAFRASDVRNYYATKLIITKPGPLPNAGLVRFIVLDGRERERVELPLPLTLERGVDYRVQVSVRGGRFLTSVNGQLVSSWMDNRLTRGGVGFFSEDGESALLKWVSVSERDSFLGRIVSHFSLISFPTAVLP
ncbi:MAG TPA: hypothetical protein VGP62_24860 [Bryobacteraceae bacterium]|jgi:hypothetical protein|nr:hypothetical protein [Bryobacteraceae bacterium]